MCVTVSNMKDLRSRCYHLILYPDDEEHCKTLDLITNSYNYALILHDKDMLENSDTLKKAHWHVILYFQNAKYLNSLAEELQIKPNYIRTEELKKGLEYLIHKNNKDKYQYDVEEVKGPLRENLLNYLSKSLDTEKTSTLLLFSIIDNFDGPITFSELIPVVLQNNLWSYFRRSQLTWKLLIEEHNRKYHLHK